MSDVALAHNLIADIAGHCWNGKGDMIERAYRAVVKHHPQWTRRRRVRALWHREAAGVRYHEMIELAETARKERADREALQEARRDHADYIARTSRLEAMLASTDEAFHRPTLEAMGGIADGMDCAGDHR